MIASCYQCVVCGTHFDDAKAHQRCSGCLSEFPSVHDVSIRVAQVAAKLRASVEAQRRYCANLNYAIEQWRLLLSSSGRARRHHAQRAIAAQRALIALSNDIGGAIETSLTGLSPSHWLDDILSLDGSNAWDIDHMLPYFYQDWHCTGDYPIMSNRICAAIAKYEKTVTRLAVIGAGACGLVRDLAAIGGEVHALDLSVSCLVLANRLLKGESIEVMVPHKFERDWRISMIPGAAHLIEQPHLCVANAARLPLQSDTFSIVVTQYLLDIATNPTQIITEIRRVLELGGLWVNVGLPFGLTNEPLEVSPLCDDALEPVLTDHGFELISLQRYAHRLSDTGSLFEWPEITTQWPQFSIARLRSDVHDRSPDLFQQFRAGISDAVWNYKPRRLPGRLLRGGPGSSSVSETSAAIVRWIGAKSDGRTPLAKLRSQVTEVAPLLTDCDLIEVVRHLCDEGMLTIGL